MTIAAGLCFLHPGEAYPIAGAALLSAQQFIFAPLAEFVQNAQTVAVGEQMFANLIDYYQPAFDEVSVGIVAFDLVDGILSSDDFPAHVNLHSPYAVHARITRLGKRFPEIRFSQLARYLQGGMIMSPRDFAFQGSLIADPRQARINIAHLRDAISSGVVHGVSYLSVSDSSRLFVKLPQPN